MLYSEENTHQYLYDNCWYPWTRLMLYSEDNTTTCMTIGDIPGLG